MVSGGAIRFPQQYCGYNVALCFTSIELRKTKMTHVVQIRKFEKKYAQQNLDLVNSFGQLAQGKSGALQMVSL